MGRGGEIGGGFCHWEELGLGFRGGVGGEREGREGTLIWVEREKEELKWGEEREREWMGS